MASQEDNSRPSSPSILSCLPPRAKKNKPSKEEDEFPIKTYADKGTQVTSDQIVDAMVYTRSKLDKDLVIMNTSGIPEVTFDQVEPTDPRIKEFARLISFEMERVAPEKRSRTFANIINLIRRVRKQDDLDDVSLPSCEESE